MHQVSPHPNKKVSVITLFRTTIKRIRRRIDTMRSMKAYVADYITRARVDLIKTAAGHGFATGSHTVMMLLQEFDDLVRRARTRQDLSNLDDLMLELDPHLGRHVEAYPGHDGAILVKTMASREGTELVEAIVKVWVGYRIAVVKTVEIDSHETKLIDSTGNVIVAFFGAGRKMHHGDAFRAFNAQLALRLVGIEVPLGEIALGDMRKSGYEPLVYELQPGGAWSVHELEAVAG